MEICQLVKLFNARKVKYLIIGASAFPVHGWARVTLDIDFFIEPTRENAAQAYEALAEFGYDVTDLTVDMLLTKKTLFRGYIVEADIHPFVTGIQNFDTLWKTRVTGTYEGEPTNYADLDSLIRMKEAAGRPKDLEDLKYLQEIKRQRT